MSDFTTYGERAGASTRAGWRGGHRFTGAARLRVRPHPLLWRNNLAVAGHGGVGGTAIALEAGMLCCLALYLYWPAFGSFVDHRLAVDGFLHVAGIPWQFAGAAVASAAAAVIHTALCSRSKLFSWLSLLALGGWVAGLGAPWALGWQSAVAVLLGLAMLLSRVALS
jgi:hypothetical protein